MIIAVPMLHLSFFRCKYHAVTITEHEQTNRKLARQAFGQLMSILETKEVRLRQGGVQTDRNEESAASTRRWMCVICCVCHILRGQPGWFSQVLRS